MGATLLRSLVVVGLVLPLGCRRTDPGEGSSSDSSGRKKNQISPTEVQPARKRPRPVPVNPGREDLPIGADRPGIPGAARYLGMTNEPSGLIKSDERSQPGYTLFVSRSARAVLLDHDGATVHSWRHPTSHHWDTAMILPNGDLLTVGADLPKQVTRGVPDEMRYLMRLDWHGKVVWKQQVLAHHRASVTANGDFAVLVFERRRIPGLFEQIDVRDERIAVFSQDGEPQTFLSLLDLAGGASGGFSLKLPEADELGDATTVDLLAANALDWARHEGLAAANPIYTPQCVLVTLRRQNRVALVDLEKKRVVWAWGADELDGPLSGRVLENGNILLLDGGGTRDWSRVVEVNPADNKIVWEYKADPPTDFYTQSKGSVQRLANGNTLLVNARGKEFFEVTPDGEQVWRFAPAGRTPGARGGVVLAERYDSDLIESLLAKFAEKKSD